MRQRPCLEANGLCADEADVVFVVASGGSDAGECTKTAPCASVAFGLTKVQDTRNVIRLDGGGTFFLSTANRIEIGKAVYIDGTNNTIMINGAGPAIRPTAE